MLYKIDRMITIIATIWFTIIGSTSDNNIIKIVCIILCGINLFDLYDKKKTKQELERMKNE